MYPQNPSPDRCLNCYESLTGDFCANCGQRRETRRYSIRTLWEGQFLEDVFQLNRGLLKTLWELLYRPGHLALDYIGGHRKRYFNFLALLLLLSAADVILRGLSQLPLEAILNSRFGVRIAIEGDGAVLDLVLKRSYRTVLLIALPIVTSLSWLMLWRHRLNFWEHFVAICFLFSGFTLISILGGLVPLLPLPEGILRLNYQVTSTVITIYVYFFYWQFTKGLYRTWLGRLWRVHILWTLTIIVIPVTLAILVSNYDSFFKGLLGG